MQFYRSMQTIKAITFDLDDTLYSNEGIVENAELHMIMFLNQYDELHSLTLADFYQEKMHISLNNPTLYHDVIAWRIETLKSIFHAYHLPYCMISNVLNESIAQFNKHRHAITIPKLSCDILAYLANRYPLAVITNGNVDITRINLEKYFQFSLRGGEKTRSKPFPEIFRLAAKQFSLPNHHILHIGDSLYADINGAIHSGMQACWLNITNKAIHQQDHARYLPHIEISQLSELYNLL